MAHGAAITIVLCALFGAIGGAPAAVLPDNPPNSPPAGRATPSLSARNRAASADAASINDCITALGSYAANVIAVVRGQTIVSIGQAGTDTVIGTASGSYAGGYSPICDIQSAIGKMVVAGTLTSIDGHPFSRIAAWDGDSWDSVGTGINGVVAALAVFRDRLVAGGQFTEAGGVPARNIAQWDGDHWRPLGAGLDGVIRHFAVWNNRLIADNGAGLYAWDGRSWTALDTSGECLSGDWLVSGLAAYDKYLVAGKLCRQCDAVSICAWDGVSWRTIGELQRGSGSPLYESGARDMTVYDGALVVGGAFCRPGSNLVRWDGKQWSGMGSGTDSAVYALTANRGRLYAGGRFTIADGESVGCLAAWEDSIKTPYAFGATIYDHGAWLYWATPDDSSYRSTTMRYATDGFPYSPAQGIPVPNGNDGVFERSSWGWDGFWHSGLTRGVTHYYSAFARYADSTYSRPATLLVTPEDYDPPYQIRNFKATASDGSVTLLWLNAYDADFKETLIRYDTEASPLFPTDGLPLPNGNQGRFEGPPSSDSTFLHSDLPNGVTYYYSAFAFDSSGNYSGPESVSATPRAMVRDFEAVADSLSISLTWRDPPDSSVRETVICFGNNDYPDHPDHGLPLPNDQGGRFQAAPGEQGGFRHAGLNPGATYYYSAFTCDSSLNYSQPVHAQARVRYVAPPVLSLWINHTTVPDPTIDLHVWANAELDPASIMVWVGGEPIDQSQGDPHTWQWNPGITGTSDSLAIMASASDLDGNYGWTESWVSAKSLSRGEAGLARSAQRRVRLEFDPQAVSQATDMVILPCRPLFEHERWVQLAPNDEPTWSYLVTPQDAIAESSAYIIFSYGGSDLDSLGSPGTLIIALEGVGVIRSYTDSVAKTLSAQISQLGLFTLDVGTGYPDRFVNQDMLVVSPVYPNPFTAEISLRFEIRASERVKIAVYDALGRRVVGLTDAGMRPGSHGVTWDGRNHWGAPAPSGVYFLSIDNGVRSSTSKVILMR